MKSIPVVKQRDLKDCGACSLSCIIKYYDGYIPLEKIRDDTFTNINGTTAYHLINAAIKYGFDAIGVKVDNIDDENIYLPCIAHLTLKNGLNHFVVIYKITRSHIFLMDPYKGKTKITKKEFNDIWTHVLILLSPITKIVKYEKETPIFLTLFKVVLSNKMLLFKFLLISIVLIILTITTNFYFKLAISSIENGKDNSMLLIIVLSFLLITIFKVIFTYLKSYYLEFINKNLDCSIYTSFIEHLFNLPSKIIENRTTGEVTSRVNDLGELKNLFSEVFLNIILNSVLIIGAIVTLYFINSKLLLILCFVLIIYLIVGISTHNILYQKFKESLNLETEFNSSLVENIELFNTLKYLDITKNFTLRLEEKLIKLLKCNFNITKFMNVLTTLKNTVSELGLFLLNTIGIYLILKGELDILSLVTFNNLLIYLFDPLKQIVDLIPRFKHLEATFNKIAEFNSLEEEKLNSGLELPKNTTINFNNVSFSYNYYYNILKNINLSINAHDKVLLEGASGSGKSTICKLLYRSLDNYTGNIAFNNICEKDYSLKSIRKNILYVGQNEKLFTASLKDNITCFRDILDNEFTTITDICELDSIIKSHQNRYNSIINASLNNLSGGEKQRIILARGLLKKAEIIILDEALSEVNIKLEEKIVDNIFKFFPDKTIIYVTHKPIKNKFDKVINLEEL